MGFVQAIEIIPGGGILYRTTHDEDNTQCQYSDYPNVDAMRNAKTDQPQQEIRCPECNELGIVIAEKDESDRAKPGTWKYLVSHPTGSQRCVIRPENRDTILKALDRYIQTETATSIGRPIGGTIVAPIEKDTKRPNRIKKIKIGIRKRKRLSIIICPRCNKLGAAFVRHTKGGALVVLHQTRHGFEKVQTHTMRTDKEKAQFITLLGKALEEEKKQRLGTRVPSQEKRSFLLENEY